ncbi:MAG: peptide-methionine (S)-S-oxide reductase MsrA [Candidatus Heimdallarchaeota archaeon]|nr:peptide-methionine (S)-S-oxide reductase MsrA [Candidatus Heimdallarchaeota archaeon]MCG3255179.1 peptide-methionine (S)-S-oxide reductase MsrA [Candidatus Heimdallarchaeota archaeon]MCK4610252.1 peptide-methionine (S)-S-oxide reductase MsrA [Candidatus Heimdallarchaeota archaeon]
MANEINLKTTTLGGGCFWCIEAIFSELKGVQLAESGYSGGKVDNPTYEQVCSGKTGHAEVVQIRFNPKIISYKEILEIFFTIHDPTTLNQQGNDIGSQYRSVIFYHSEEQKKVAQKIISKLDSSKKWKNPVVTEVSSFDKYYKAVDYHQNYFKLNASQPYCKAVIEPKVNKFRKLYFNQLK